MVKSWLQQYVSMDHLSHQLESCSDCRTMTKQQQRHFEMLNHLGHLFLLVASLLPLKLFKPIKVVCISSLIQVQTMFVTNQPKIIICFMFEQIKYMSHVLQFFYIYFFMSVARIFRRSSLVKPESYQPGIIPQPLISWGNKSITSPHM